MTKRKYANDLEQFGDEIEQLELEAERQSKLRSRLEAEHRRLYPKLSTAQMLSGLKRAQARAERAKKNCTPRVRRLIERTEAREAKAAKLNPGRRSDKDFDFPDLYLTKNGLRMFARERRHSWPAIEDLIRGNKLKPEKSTGGWKKYSTMRLGILLKNYNEIW